MIERVKVAVVGAGFMGQLHARTVNECDSAELVAIVDLNESLGQEVAARYGSSYVRNVEELLEKDSVDTFIVALPDRLHVDVTSKILLAGKSVLLEKPMADTLEGARQIAEAEKKGGGRLMVAHLLRFDPRYVGAANAVANGSIGEVVHVSAKRFSLRNVGKRLAGSSSVCFYLGVHDVDALQWVSGKRITSVYARSVAKLMPSYGINSEDAIFANFQYDDGTIGSLEISWALPDYMPSGINANLEVVGTEGVVRLDTSDHGLNVINQSGVVLPDGLHWPEVNNQIVGDLRDEILHFITAVRDGNEFVISVEEAMRAVAVNDAILKSVESGVPVDVERI